MAVVAALPVSVPLPALSLLPPFVLSSDESVAVAGVAGGSAAFAATTAFAASGLAAVALSGCAVAAVAPLAGELLRVFVLLDGTVVTAAAAPFVASAIAFDLVFAIAAAVLLPLAPISGLVAFAAPELGVESAASAGGLAPLVASGTRRPTGFAVGVLFAADAAEPLAVFAAALLVVSVPLVAGAGALASFASPFEPPELPAFDPSDGAEVCWEVVCGFAADFGSGAEAAASTKLPNGSVVLSCADVDAG